MAKGSLLPENAIGGGGVANGDYTITCRTGMFDYQGQAEAVVALFVQYKDADGNETEQAYSAGKGATLSPEHKEYEFDAIGKNSNAWQWINSILDAGFPKDKVDADVRVFNGTKVSVESKAQPKRGLQGEKEGKTIVLVTKVLSVPGAKKGPAPVPKPVAAAASTTISAAPAAVASNGEPSDMDMEAIVAVQEQVAANPGITRMKLGTNLALSLTKAKNPNMAPIRKLATTPEWLAAHAELGGWKFDADALTLA